MHETDRHRITRLQPPWLLYTAALAGFLIHGGTAILRLQSFFPVPKLIDFAAFYASASALSQGLSPYALSAQWLDALQTQKFLPFAPPAIYNPPLWPWLLQPIAELDYPAAAWVWLLFNTGILLWLSFCICTKLSAPNLDTQHVTDRVNLLPHIRPVIRQNSRSFIIISILIISFGPVFLDLSIGQTSILLLMLCVIIGFYTHRENNWAAELFTALSIALAAVTKLYPIAWVPYLALTRKWKHLALSTAFTAAAFLSGFLLMPEVNREYWQHYLPHRLENATDHVSMDDQSLPAWLDRISRPHSYDVPGLNSGVRTQIVWKTRWAIDPQLLQIGSYILGVIFGIPVFYTLTSANAELDDGGFYLWVLYILAIFPHMERYNHVLLLPAMLWLWHKGQRSIVIAAYLLTAFSRLNHLWILVLPAPWGPLASGFGLFAVFILAWGIFKEIRSQNTVMELQ
ncbi:MAG: glycosyltransferase family 87 protein [Anaerolineae bacterium]|nr:glycosyltransferase family 87 protein [Anaerolineae bacterium]